MLIRLALLAIFVMHIFSGCVAARHGGAKSETLDESAQASIVNQESHDLQLALTRVGPTITVVSEPSGVGELSEEVCGGTDCTSYLESKSNDPQLLPVIIHPAFQCQFVSITVALREDAYTSPYFTGIGFWTDLGGTVFFEKSRFGLPTVRRLLKTGGFGVHYRVAAVMACFDDSRSALDFKGFAQFERGTTRYRNWEKITQNHHISVQSGLELQENIYAD